MTDVRPLSHGQEAQWFLHRLVPGATAYLTGVAVRIRDAVDVAAFGRAVDLLAVRHEMLRSTFTTDGGRPVRLVRAASRLRLEHHALGAVGEEELRSRVAGALAAPYRLDENGAFRIVLWTRPDGDAVLLVGGHHLATDAASDAVLLRDLLRLYASCVTGTDARLPVLRGGFDEEVAKERALLASPRGAELGRYWQRICHGSAAAELPTDLPRPAMPSLSGATCRVAVPAATAARLREVARAAGVTPFALLLGAFQGLLYRSTRQRDFLVGCPVTTRMSSNSLHLVGNFINTIVLRAEIAPSTSFHDLAVAVAEQVRTGVDAIRYPFSLVARDLGRRAPAAGRARAYAISFNMLSTAHLEPRLRPVFETGRPDTTTDYAGLALRPYPLPQQEGQLDLGVDVVQGADTLTFDFRYDGALFERETVERLAQHYVRAVEIATTEPATQVARAPLWAAAPVVPATPAAPQTTDI
ncbi:condensation domain-containing protein [Streptomyces sp. NPDC002935]|uniref:condensation domain-containing protein n=1 Tax=Streptomyces sp. NPDC002935 TaxID=3154545 RepID=UPI0033A05E7E